MSNLTEQQIIDLFKDAPEGATHHFLDVDDGSMDGFAEYRDGKHGKQYYAFDNSGFWSEEDLDEDFVITPKPVTSPTFTQDMADNGELPSVGMECCYSSSSMIIWNKCTVIAYYDGFVWTSDNGIRPLANTRFRPLTPPIELIDGKAYQFTYDSDECTGIAMKGLFLIPHVSGSMFHAGPTDCTNIQLLEVKS